ncbi:uncharacterized protein B0T15DRAFT_562708 [Chaetomium strumarium]|uniref:Uncharacterized protein n=1 Tax=Chaetomium strumarium TaxID=1170767 RepID=A0AAJ0GMJ7_9PEZI|nr:hypothetical protein B0T15DRAFT_562708 [Chaetomium strumarium]
MQWTAVKVASQILRHHHGVTACVIGDLALTYYNAPGKHNVSELELCVPDSSVNAAPGLLCSTGLFEPADLRKESAVDIQLHMRLCMSKYRLHFPSLRTTGWTEPLVLILLPASFFGLGRIEDLLVKWPEGRSFHLSKYLLAEGLGQNDIERISFPRLKPLITWLGKSYLYTNDGYERHPLQDLVDGLNLDEVWIQNHLQDANPALAALLKGFIRTKRERIYMYGSDNTVTRFIKDEKEAEDVKRIPGYE